MAYFITLHKRRRYTEAGPEPVSIVEIKAYAEILGLNQETTLRLVDIVGQLDDVVFSSMAKKPKPGEPGAQS